MTTISAHDLVLGLALAGTALFGVATALLWFRRPRCDGVADALAMTGLVCYLVAGVAAVLTVLLGRP